MGMVRAKGSVGMCRRPAAGRQILETIAPDPIKEWGAASVRRVSFKQNQLSEFGSGSCALPAGDAPRERER